ncbi:DUF2628 domain-containing protein [Xanthomonas campestris pv. olitorii]|uniref:DUF2628 domain-containing protein n=1 Tax=Xanthomonas axonopodis TaxID=53413 RepID=UPI001C583411|nr:DUF2628 domain-containing protein [Xanthomonas campestris pv. olitorii]
MNTFDRTQLSPKWQFRFAFFDRHGGPRDPAYKEALKTLPFGEKLKVGMNFYALFFGFIYFFILGLWRKALGLIGVGLVVGIVASFLPASIGNALSIPLALLAGMSANYAYYLDKVKGSTSFNPFEGMRW